MSADQARERPQYSMVITWSPKDAAYLVRLPEWMPYVLNQIAVTHGTTYEEAARHGQEVLQMLIEEYQESGKALPTPQIAESDNASTTASARSANA